MAYKRNVLKFVKGTSNSNWQSYCHPADDFLGMISVNGTTCKASFIDGDATPNIDADHYTMTIANVEADGTTTNMKENFKVTCMRLAGVLAGHSLRPGSAVVVRDNEQKISLKSSLITNVA